MAGIDRHALGLDVALGVLQPEGGQDRAEWQAAAHRLLQAIRAGDLGDLTQADDVSRNVQVVLLYSVRAQDGESQRRFRWLGAFAAAAPFTTPEAAAAWGCDEEGARADADGLCQRRPAGAGHGAERKRAGGEPGLAPAQPAAGRGPGLRDDPEQPGGPAACFG